MKLKRIAFAVFVNLFLGITGLHAQDLTLNLTSGQKLTGVFIDKTDTTIAMLINGHKKAVIIPAAEIAQGYLPHNTKLFVEDGKIVIITPNNTKNNNAHNAILKGNPNYTIGKALEVSGATSLGIGVPCLVAGLATCIAANVGDVSTSNAVAKSRCATASYYLFGTGAALTIVGIPLYVSGKKIMELNVNYTGNGAGVSVNF